MTKKVTKTATKKTLSPKTPWPAAQEGTAPKARTLAEVQNEYGQLAAQAGDLHFRIVCTQRDLSTLNTKLFQLNQEAAYLQSLAPSAPATAPAPSAEAATN